MQTLVAGQPGDRFSIKVDFVGGWKHLAVVPLTEAARNVGPVAVTASESIERLRDRASGSCLDADADTSGICMRKGDRQRTSQQTIPRDPSVN